MNPLMVRLGAADETSAFSLISALTACTSNDTSPNRSWPFQLARNLDRDFAFFRFVAMNTSSMRLTELKLFKY